MIKKLFRFGITLGTSRTARNIYWVFSGNGIALVLAFFTTVLIAHFVSKEDFGLYLALYTFANLLADFADFGTSASLSSFIPSLLVQKKETEAKNFLTTAFFMEMIISGVLLLVILPLSPFLSQQLFASTSPLHVVITGGTMYTLLLFNFAIFALSAHHKFKESAVVNISTGVVRLAILLIIVFFAKLNLTNILFAFFISPLLSFIYALLHLGLLFLKPEYHKDKLKQILHFSSVLGVQKIFVAVSARLDLLMLVPLAGALETGVYGAASRVSQVFPFFISSLSQVFAPKFAQFQHPKEALSFFKKTAMVIAMFLFGLALFYIFAEPLFRILFPKYSESIPVFRALLLALIGFVAATPFVSFLVYTLKKPALVTFASFVQLAVIFLANLYFVPKIGRFGPVVGIGLGNVAMLLISSLGTWYYLMKADENRH